MKRRTHSLTALLLAALMMLAVCSPLALAGDLPPIPLTTKKTRVAGDANADKKVTLEDAVAISRHLAGGWDVSINTDNADVNADKKVDLKDVVLILRYLADGWEVTLQ